MQTHSLDRLLKLVDTAYYQQDGNKAVCEVVEHAKDGCIIVTLLVNGRSASIDEGSVQAVLGKHGLRVEGWTTKPQV